MHLPTSLRALSSLFNLICLVQGQQGSLQDGALQQQILANTPTNYGSAINITSSRPFYAIAHRVLSSYGVEAAVQHGANALEIDMTAWKQGWWADHDGHLTSYGDKAEDLFKVIRRLRERGETIIFVWLDLKNPDWCDPDDPKWRLCSIDALRDLARSILEPVGVQVLFGFYENQVGGKAFRRVRDGLNAREAIDIEGTRALVRSSFLKFPVPKQQSIMSYGWGLLEAGFGDCQEKEYKTCTELRQAVEMDAFGKVFSWTLTHDQSWYGDKLMGTARVDGLIYGAPATEYKDNGYNRDTFTFIFKWLRYHDGFRHLATQSEKPW
ncbi:unnamed protein product [Clonostachys solani]|uniref:Phospholipase D n=1 Tax=Clonostachys solani TaxID=160281 RepID=A0A9P0EPH3_9HYPO|nr:unnamed protein product [Clonostachys solani]